MISEIDQLLAAKEKEIPHRLTDVQTRTLIDVERRRPRNRRTGSNRSPACGDHHGRQRALGGRRAVCRARKAIAGASRRCAASVRAAHELGVLYLTIFSFSSENWSRPATEIGDLFGLLRRFIRNDLATLHRDGVRVRVIGERDGLEPDICALLNEAEELTRAQHQAQSRRRVQLRIAPGNRQAQRSGWRAKSRRASAIPHRSTPTRSAGISMRPIFPIPT